MLNIGPPPRKFFPQDLLRQHPLVVGLAFFAFSGADGIDLVTGRTPNLYQGYTSLATPYGVGSTIAQGVGNGEDYGTAFQPIPSGSTAYSIASLAAPPNVSRITKLWSQETGSGNFPQVSLCPNCDNGGLTGPGRITLVEYDGGMKNAVETSLPGTCDGNYHIFSASRNGSPGGSMYRDGANNSLSALGSGATAAFSSPHIYACGANGEDNAADYPVVFNAVWTRVLSDLEHLAFATNPWQIFVGNTMP